MDRFCGSWRSVLVTNNPLIGRALALALCTAALSACSNANPSNSGQRDSASSSSDADAASKNDTEKQLRDAIAQAPANGLKPELFLKGGEKGAELTQAALKYASALANGYSDPNKLFEVYTIPRANTDVRAGMQQALQNGNVGEWLNSLAPQTQEYKALSSAFQRYAKVAAQAQGQSINTDKPIKPGAHDQRIPAIAAFLRAGGYLAENKQQSDRQTNGQQKNEQQQKSGQQARGGEGASGAATYSPGLVQAVKKYQSDSGLKSDGILGRNTLESLNDGASGRARQLAVAMERLRWLQREPPKTRIDVNTAATLLDYFRDGQHVGQRKVVAGEPDKPTPQLQAPVYRLVAKPTWTVPKDIAEKELADKGDAWLKKNNFVMKDGYYVQQSGPKSALGLVKLDMQDDQAIYLHDTPAKSLFGLDNRHRSHGCVRVENAVGFAKMLAQQEGVLDQFNQAMQKDDQNFVKLPNEIPVRLLYQTAFWDGSRIQFRPDIYGWDQNIAKALELAAGPPRKIEQPQSDDIGP